jgi:hypothetical protein
MERLALFHNLVNLAAADNKFTEEELEFLAVRAENWGISNDEFETAIAGLSTGTAQIHLPHSKRDRVELLREMIRLFSAEVEISDIDCLL